MGKTPTRLLSAVAGPARRVGSVWPRGWAPGRSPPRGGAAGPPAPSRRRRLATRSGRVAMRRSSSAAATPSRLARRSRRRWAGRRRHGGGPAATASARSGRLVSPTVSVAAAAVAANASARERSMLVGALVRERFCVRTAPESRVSGGYRLQVSWPQLLRVCSRRSSVTKEEAVMMMSVLITSPLPDRERRSCARCRASMKMAKPVR